MTMHRETRHVLIAANHAAAKVADDLDRVRPLLGFGHSQHIRHGEMMDKAREVQMYLANLAQERPA